MTTRDKNRIYMDDNFELLEDTEGNIIISVLCGSIGLYEVEFILNTEEIKNYKESGIDFLKALARKVQYEPLTYINR